MVLGLRVYFKKLRILLRNGNYYVKTVQIHNADNRLQNLLRV
jgi:hypothetical protein